MHSIWKAFNILSSLKVAILLLLLIAISSALGTAIPQSESISFYVAKYHENPWLGMISDKSILRLQLNHVYSSFWFLTLLSLLGVSLIMCSWKRQWPKLKSAIQWLEYNSPKQILKLAVAETITTENPSLGIEKLSTYLTQNGWQIKKKKYSLSARRGVIGRFGPPLVHFGLIILMIGATFGAIKGQKIESFLVPGRSIDLISPNKSNKISFELEKFKIERSSNGQPEQFVSQLKLTDNSQSNPIYKEISVNHPLRYNGITIYQADWSLSSITIQLGNSPKLQLPLTLIPELGEQVWGVILPSLENNKDRILITVSNENGPIKVFNQDGNLLGLTRAEANPIEINRMQLKLLGILPSSGILIKYDPGIPFVYIGFAITLIGSILSVIPTKLLWVLSAQTLDSLYVGGLSNRDLAGFSREFPRFIKEASK